MCNWSQDVEVQTQAKKKDVYSLRQMYSVDTSTAPDLITQGLKALSAQVVCQVINMKQLVSMHMYRKGTHTHTHTQSVVYLVGGLGTLFVLPMTEDAPLYPLLPRVCTAIESATYALAPLLNPAIVSACFSVFAPVSHTPGACMITMQQV
jgi:hypothetical protein